VGAEAKGIKVEADVELATRLSWMLVLGKRTKKVSADEDRGALPLLRKGYNEIFGFKMEFSFKIIVTIFTKKNKTTLPHPSSNVDYISEIPPTPAPHSHTSASSLSSSKNNTHTPKIEMVG